MKRLLQRIVAAFDERESPTALVLIRVLLATVMLSDLLWIGYFGVSDWLWAPVSDGGISPAIHQNPPVIYQWFGLDAGTATLIYVVLLVSITMFGLGCFTRTSGLVFVFVYAQSAMANDYGDRGIDRAVRVVMLILSFSAAGAAYSFDAWRKTGSWRGDGKPVPAWPRFMVLGQLVLVYCAAGFSKGGTLWFPWGGYGALYVILQDPIYAKMSFAFLEHPVLYFFTQVGTGITHTWEMGAPVVLLAAYYRRTAERGGFMRRWFERLRVRDVYVFIGVGFHLSLAVTMYLGIFPWAMLAFFPAFFRPEEIERFGARVKARLRRYW